MHNQIILNCFYSTYDGLDILHIYSFYHCNNSVMSYYTPIVVLQTDRVMKVKCRGREL